MLSRVAQKSFLLVKADWQVAKALELLVLFDESRPPHIVVEQTGPEDRYYLFRNSEVISLFRNAPPEVSIDTVLRLSECEPTPVLDGYDDELERPALAVVIDDGYIVGFIDSNADNQERLAADNQERLAFESAYLTAVSKTTLESSDQGALSTAVRAVVMDFPAMVALGQIAPLTVQLSTHLMEGQAVVDLELSVDLDVRVEPIRRFEVIGVRGGGIPIQQRERAVKLRFHLKATQLGLGVIRVCLSQQGQRIVSVTLECQIEAYTTNPADGPAVTATVPLPAAEILVPDLSLTIIEDKEGGELCLRFELRTREDLSGIKVEQPFEPIMLGQKKPEAYFRAFFNEFEGQSTKGIRDFLHMQGSDLFHKLVPESLRKVLWFARNRIESVQILSDDPWIPWELLTLQGWENDALQAGEFLSEVFAMTRWMPKLKPKTQLKLSNVAVVVADDARLKNAQEEKQHLLSMANAYRRVTPLPARRMEVLKELSSGKYDAWHFVCHGFVDPSKPTKAVLKLDKGDTIEPSFLSSAPIQNLGKAQPLVFVNACQSGKATSALVGPDGWAMQFLKAGYDAEHPDNGASAFIGAYWSIQSDSASRFARRVYDSLLNKRTIGEAVREARLAIRSDDDPTSLAYTVFAHPLARVQEREDSYHDVAG